MHNCTKKIQRFSQKIVAFFNISGIIHHRDEVNKTRKEKAMNERDKYINEMMKKANALLKNYTWELNNEVWNMAYDWNASHNEEEEIFMSDMCDDEGNVNGFMIEDDYWIFED